MLYMHSAGIVHRDIKPSNILANKNCDVKICDLGLGRGGIDLDKADEADDVQASNKEPAQDEEITEYVVTRWYRAPEVILCPSEYTKAVDIWSCGCVFAELLGRKPLFPGDHYLDQIQKIISVLGTPSEDQSKFVTNTKAREFLFSLAKRKKLAFSSLYPDGNPVALDLLAKMLAFNPNDRYTVEQCLAHPYFEGLHNPEEEPICEEVFDWSIDSVELTKENLQKLIYKESLKYYPKK